MSKPLTGKTILVVDDERDIREILVEELEALGANAMGAANIQLALQAASQSWPDAVLSDMRMPGGDGLSLLKSLRARLSEAQPQFFFITGFAELTQEEAEAIGAQGLITKPFNLAGVREMLVRHLNSPDDL